jgi:hypothetical protein
MSATLVDADLRERFQQLKDDWKTRSRHLSNPAQMAILEPYQKIIAMGPRALPLILAELRQEPDHWFWALEMIADENPVPSEAAGKVREMALAWVEWGQQRGLIE